jgi:hypothetical protein
MIIAQFEGDMMDRVSPVASAPDHSAAITARRAAGSLRLSSGALSRVACRGADSLNRLKEGLNQKTPA